jgi:hypothetical protein
VVVGNEDPDRHTAFLLGSQEGAKNEPGEIAKFMTKLTKKRRISQENEQNDRGMA